jgi:flagellar hook-length control protein FliK
MLAVKSSEKQNPALDINYRCNVNFDKVTFDSLINNFRAETPSKAPEQSRYSKEINDQGYAGKADEINARQKQTDRLNNADQENYKDEYEQVKGRTDETERNEYTNAGEANKGSEVEPDKYTDKSEQVNGSGTVAVDKNTEVSDETELNNDNGVKAGAFLYAMAHGFADGMTEENKTSENEMKGQTSGKSADGGMKTGSLLFSMANGPAEESKTAAVEGTVQTDNVIKAENGLKAGILLKDLMKGNSQVNTETKMTQVTDAEKTEVIDINQPKAEKGLKAGTLLSDRAMVNANEKTIDDGLINSQIKASGPTAEDLKDTGKNTLKTAGNNGDTKQNIINEFKVQGEASGPDLVEENSNARILTGRGMSELAENFARQGGSRNVDGKSSKAIRVNTENSSIAGSSTSAEIGKANEGLSIAKAARPAAFNEIADKIIYSMKGNNRIGVTLESETLGKLNMNLTINKGIVNVHINAADSAIKELVENNINNIIETLSKNGVSVGGFSVGLKNHKNNDNNHGANENANKNKFAIEKENESDYTKAGMYMRRNDGLVSVFA